MRRECLMVVLLFLAVVLVANVIVFTPPAQGSWIWDGKTLINPDNEPLEWIPPGTGYEGSIIRWTVNETSMTEEERSVRNGYEWYDVSLTATFDKPPAELIPGETIMLSITYSYGGTLNGYSPGIAFDYMLDGEVLTGDPDILGFAPWSPYFDGLTSSTYSVLVPSAHSGEMKITAFLLNRAACIVTWVYQAEDTITTTIEPTTTTTSTDPTTTTTTPADTTTTTTGDCLTGQIDCGDECCTALLTYCCREKYCCFTNDEECCWDGCCESGEECSAILGCVDEDLVCLLEFLYGEDSVEVKLLRNYRDEILSHTPIGQKIIELYYLWSPAIAKAMEEDEAYKEEVKGMIDEVLELIGGSGK